VKHFAITTILAALVASGQADAAHVASKAECLSACLPQIATACGGVRPAKHNRCRLALVRQCRRFGPKTMCPVSAPPSPPTTISTMPVATTTTTTAPFIPPTTTTTLPPPGPWTGVWNFVGSLYSNTCSSAATPNAGQYTIVQTGLTVRVTLTSIPTYIGLGDVAPDGSFAASGPWTTGICNFVTLLAATPTGGVIGTSVPASAGITANCQGAYNCETIFNGVLTRVQ
jgi:hypothetical protein